MKSDTRLHRWLGCLLSLQKHHLNTTAIADNGVETAHRPLDVLTAPFRIATLPYRGKYYYILYK